MDSMQCYGNNCVFVTVMNIRTGRSIWKWRYLFVGKNSTKCIMLTIIQLHLCCISEDLGIWSIQSLIVHLEACQDNEKPSNSTTCIHLWSRFASQSKCHQLVGNTHVLLVLFQSDPGEYHILIVKDEHQGNLWKYLSFNCSDLKPTWNCSLPSAFHEFACISQRVYRNMNLKIPTK